MKITKELAELIGIILGDGHIHTTSNTITIVGSLEDLEYYQNTVMPLFQNTFNKTTSLRKRNDRKAYYLTVTSKEIMDFLVQKIGLKRGSKEKATIPDIITAQSNLIIPFLRGLFDTDGCIKFSKQTRKINYYPRIQYSLQKSPLVYQLGDLLRNLKFPLAQWEDNRFNGQVYYQISGRINTERWFSEVKPKNPVHTTKYAYWKEFGHYTPKSTLQFRKTKLRGLTQIL